VVRLGRVVDSVQDCMPEEGNIAHDLYMSLGCENTTLVCMKTCIEQKSGTNKNMNSSKTMYCRKSPNTRYETQTA
jgi:hypothetical protein